MLASALAPAPAVAAEFQPVSGPSCQDIALPVSLGDEGPVTATMAGRLCLPPGALPSTVQLLIHGAGYTSAYWDLPVDNGYYSYVRVANAAGYATLAIDRVGSGRSTRPASSQVTYTSTISTLHQVVRALRNGLAGHRFSRVALVGHSFGSVYAAGVAAAYRTDADAIILTGSGHRTSPSFSAMVNAEFYPAAQEQRFATLDAGWLTTRPGTIGALHYYRPGADPRVIAYDEAHKDVVSSAEFATRPADLGVVWSQIHVPVLLITGTKDIHYCAPDGIDCSSQKSFRDSESRFFSPDAAVRTILVAFTGHDLTMHATAPLSAALMTAWSRQFLPPRTVNHRPVNGTPDNRTDGDADLSAAFSQLDNTIEGET